MKKRLLIISTVLLISVGSCNGSENIEHTNSNSLSQETLNDKDTEDVILTMASRGSSIKYRIGNENLINRFNEMDNGYKIIEVDYGEYFDGGNEETAESWTDKDRELILDVMKGGIVDIVPNVFNDSGKYISLAEKGAFVDLYPFIENDPQIDGDMLFSHVLETTEINDQLTYMPLSFSINTLAGKSKYVGLKENWTMDDLKHNWKGVYGKVNFSYSDTKGHL